GAFGWTLTARHTYVGFAPGEILCAAADLAPLAAPYGDVGKRKRYGEEIGVFGRTIGSRVDVGLRGDGVRCWPLPNGTRAHDPRASPTSSIASSASGMTAAPGRLGVSVLHLVPIMLTHDLQREF